ncbi:unnamed protein product [Heligmosomoides polygyrus]|uniref:Synapsin domain-containing protein n=1 Tax=Heligmosomoides polygyrus TaxID=6339 RepID=A0A183GP19_HELPZ|nr:unnamed protein product [Heligmosomoides polygyrus]
MLKPTSPYNASFVCLPTHVYILNFSAPTSPARTSESLAAALERSLLYDRSRGAPVMPPDAKVLLIIDNQVVDWSKYFRNPNEFPIRVEQADFPELDVLATEHSLTVEINQPGRDPRHGRRRVQYVYGSLCTVADAFGTSTASPGMMSMFNNRFRYAVLSLQL